MDGGGPADTEMADAQQQQQPIPQQPTPMGGGGGGMENIPATLSHGGRFIQYNIFGNIFEVTAKYKPPIMPIGKGAYGIVCSALNSETTEHVAIKKIANAFDNKIDAKRTLREIKLLRHMYHENLLNYPSFKVEGTRQLKCKALKMELTITQPDDWHLHLRDGDLLQAVVPHSASCFGRAIVMPNLKPPITTTAAAVAYHESILKALPADSNFSPLMTLYLTDTTSPDEIKLAKESGVLFAVKLYPAGATTNSQDGVTDLFGKCLSVLEEMAEQNIPLLVHGEVTDPNVDVFDREKVFIDTILQPLIKRLPQLKVVMEHITTLEAVRFVESCSYGRIAAAQLLLPVLKREIHRQAIVSAVTSGNKKFFLGTDSAPHEKRRKECPCGCAGIYNADAPVAVSLYAKVFEEAGALDKLEAFKSQIVVCRSRRVS